MPEQIPDPQRVYQDRKTAFAADLASARQASNSLSNARLATVLIALAGFFWFIFRDDLIPSLAFILLGTAAFLFLMVRHDKALAREIRSAQLLAINEAGLQRLQGDWNRFADDGREFADESHAYAGDLDLFGPASLFQWLNAARTRLGRLQLRGLLLDPPRSREAIAADQAMIRELAVKVEWRQRFEAAGGYPPAKAPKEDPEAMFAWAEDRTEFFSRPVVASALRFLPILSFAYAAYSFVQHGLSVLMLPPFLAHAAIASWNGRRNGKVLAAICRQKENLEIYLELLTLGETGGFADPGLQALSETLTTAGGLPGSNPIGGKGGNSGATSASSHASQAVRRLQRLADHLETRLNPLLSHLVNALFLWDLQWLWAFRRWRAENGSSLRAWIHVVARLETLSSLALPAFENPEWVFPELLAEPEDYPLLDAEAMAHPLLPKTVRVGNDLRIGRPGEVVIITGSNMSGKSTMMRTVGTNLVLAYAGAPVCASGFRCGRVEVHTSMRLKDDLEKRISSFYAELLRIKGIVEAAKAGRRVLFLVDEIFRGTNSKDRHAGAMAVLRQLHDLKAAGLVSTHDLELARLEEMEPESFRNFHFQEQYSDGKIAFDYRMRTGVSRTTNAMHLLRMVGLGLADPPRIP